MNKLIKTVLIGMFAGAVAGSLILGFREKWQTDSAAIEKLISITALLAASIIVGGFSGLIVGLVKHRIQLESAKNQSEVIKNYAQIVAVIIAAIWTFYLFVKLNSPGLETRGSVTDAINWYALGGSDKFLVDFHVDIENKGTTSFDISKIHVRAWEFAEDMQKEGLEYVDPTSVRGREAFFDRTYDLTQTSQSLFPSHYPPGTVVGNTFDWVVKPDCKKWLLFAADVYKKGDGDAATWSAYKWWQECPGPGESGRSLSNNSGSPPPSPNNSSSPAR